MQLAAGRRTTVSLQGRGRAERRRVISLPPSPASALSASASALSASASRKEMPSTMMLAAAAVAPCRRPPALPFSIRRTSTALVTAAATPSSDSGTTSRRGGGGAGRRKPSSSSKGDDADAMVNRSGGGSSSSSTKKKTSTTTTTRGRQSSKRGASPSSSSSDDDDDDPRLFVQLQQQQQQRPAQLPLLDRIAAASSQNAGRDDSEIGNIVDASDDGEVDDDEAHLFPPPAWAGRRGGYTPFEFVDFTDEDVLHEVRVTVRAPRRHVYEVWADRLNYGEWFSLLGQAVLHHDSPELASYFVFYRWGHLPPLELYATLRRDLEEGECVLERSVDGWDLAVGAFFEDVDDGDDENGEEGDDGGGQRKSNDDSNKKTLVTLRLGYALPAPLAEHVGSVGVYGHVEEILKSDMRAMKAFVEAGAGSDLPALRARRGAEEAALAAAVADERRKGAESVLIAASQAEPQGLYDEEVAELYDGEGRGGVFGAEDLGGGRDGGRDGGGSGSGEEEEAPSSSSQQSRSSRGGGGGAGGAGGGGGGRRRATAAA